MTTTIRFPVAILFLISMSIAGYLGFASIHLSHDKLIHFVTFLVLTIEFYFIFDTQYKTSKVLSYITLAICTFGGGIGSEIVQSLVNPQRVFDWNDIGCNIVGSIIGLIASSFFQQWRSKRARAHRLRYRKLRNVEVGTSAALNEEAGIAATPLEEAAQDEALNYDSKHVEAQVIDDSDIARDFVNIELKNIKD